MAYELKPCPFCGGRARLERSSAPGRPVFAVTCSDARCMAYVGWYHSEYDAVSYWNRRRLELDHGA